MHNMIAGDLSMCARNTIATRSDQDFIDSAYGFEKCPNPKCFGHWHQ